MSSPGWPEIPFPSYDFMVFQSPRDWVSPASGPALFTSQHFTQCTSLGLHHSSPPPLPRPAAAPHTSLPCRFPSTSKLCSKLALFVSSFNSILQSPLSAIPSLFLGWCAQMGTEMSVPQCVRAPVPAGAVGSTGMGIGQPLKNAPVCPRSPGNTSIGSLLVFTRVFVEYLWV